MSPHPARVSIGAGLRGPCLGTRHRCSAGRGCRARGTCGAVQHGDIPLPPSPRAHQAPLAWPVPVLRAPPEQHQALGTRRSSAPQLSGSSATALPTGRRAGGTRGAGGDTRCWGGTQGAGAQVPVLGRLHPAEPRGPELQRQFWPRAPTSGNEARMCTRTRSTHIHCTRVHTPCVLASSPYSASPPCQHCRDVETAACPPVLHGAQSVGGSGMGPVLPLGSRVPQPGDPQRLPTATPRPGIPPPGLAGTQPLQQPPRRKQPRCMNCFINK